MRKLHSIKLTMQHHCIKVTYQPNKTNFVASNIL